LLVWDQERVDLSLVRFTAKQEDVRTSLTRTLNGRSVKTAALDGPLRNDLNTIGVYRAAEQILTRQLWRHIGKPAQSSTPNGIELNVAANSVARILIEIGAVEIARHEGNILPVSIVEAFPTTFLGVMLKAGFPVKRGKRSDSYYKHLTAGESGGALGGLIRRLLPGRRIPEELSRVSNHDERAAIVCAISALCIAKGQYTAVGDENGFIIMPPVGGSENSPGVRDWAWRHSR